MAGRCVLKDASNGNGEECTFGTYPEKIDGDDERETIHDLGLRSWFMSALLLPYSWNGDSAA